MGTCLYVYTKADPDNKAFLGKLYGYAPYGQISTSWGRIYKYIGIGSLAIDDPKDAYEIFSNYAQVVTEVSADVFRRFIFAYAVDKATIFEGIDVTKNPLKDLISSKDNKILEWM
jgi:hypothetical protein